MFETISLNKAYFVIKKNADLYIIYPAFKSFIHAVDLLFLHLSFIDEYCSFYTWTYTSISINSRLIYQMEMSGKN